MWVRNNHFKIFLGARVGHLNISVEKLKYEIDVQEKRLRD